MMAYADDMLMEGASRHGAGAVQPHDRARQHRAEAREYALYSVLLFPFAVLAVTVQRLAGRGRSAGARHERRPFFSEVMELNRTTVPWIFMGR